MPIVRRSTLFRARLRAIVVSLSLSLSLTLALALALASASAAPAAQPPASAPAQAGGAANPSGVPYDTARATLKDLLARGDFERVDQDTWSAALKRWILQRLASIIDRLGGTHLPTDALGQLLAWGLALAALGAMTLWLWRSLRPSTSPRLLDAAAQRLTSREWAVRARTALRDGDGREALRCGYHAALFRLEEQGLWIVDDARTPREYLSLLPAGDDRRTALVTLTRDFELTWYGSRAADVTRLLERLEVFGCAAPPESTI